MSLNPEVRRGGNLPFGMVASCWMCDPRYSTNARTLYAILVTYADTQGRTTAKGKPYRPELAAQMGVSVSTVDRTLVEMEVAGMVVIEERVDPANPTHNDSNVYHLQDYPLMYAGNGEWKDPLSRGVKAADVAKELIERRRAEKRAKGIARKGGVPKGVNPKKVREQRQSAEQGVDEEGGGSTGAAGSGSTHAATPAAPVLRNVYSPVQTPSREEDVLPDGRRPSSGSRGLTPVENSGFAASGKTSSSPNQHDDTRRPARGQKGGSKKEGRKYTAAEWEQINAVRAFLPPEVGDGLPYGSSMSDAILTAMGEGRTAEQLRDRIWFRWANHGFADIWAEDGRFETPVGVAVALVRPLRRGDRFACPDLRCENGADVDTKEPCRLCAERLADWRAERARKRGQTPRQSVSSAPAGTGSAEAALPPQRAAQDAPAVQDGAAAELHNAVDVATEGLPWWEVEAARYEQTVAGREQRNTHPASAPF
ncbi:hypothetical protein OG402_41015 [Streptomyces anulatus]|uniref:hypothetical protein n=1 Tax=Streptomyces anulatus TaxID=1892 RepID=UPI00224D8AB3|nr:hypothetical protein [Streptomyces anulatus]MCX4606810.1 hypothetical protein [Streptomyces anulatus]